VTPIWEIPTGAEKIDCAGLSLFPGMVDVSSVLWLSDRAKTTSASDASLQVLDGVDPFRDDWYEVAAQGVAAVYLQPSASGTTGGFGALLATVPTKDEESELVAPQVIARDVALQVSLGVGAQNNRSRAQQYDRVKKLFSGAKSYGEKWTKYNDYMKKKEASKKGKAKDDKKSSKSEAEKSNPGEPEVGGGRARRGPRGGQKGRGDAGVNAKASEEAKGKVEEESEKDKKSDEKSEKAPEKPDKDPIKEQLLLVLKGETPVRLRLSSADDLYYAQKLAEEFKDIKWLYEGLDNLGIASNDFVSEARPVALGPWLDASAEDEAAEWVATFEDHEGVLAIGSFADESRGSKFLRHHAASAVATGLSLDKALRGVTLDAARFAGAGDSLGIFGSRQAGGHRRSRRSLT
jgi:imidazolonepropionase-like amidohydrolase